MNRAYQLPERKSLSHLTSLPSLLPEILLEILQKGIISDKRKICTYASEYEVKRSSMMASTDIHFIGSFLLFFVVYTFSSYT